MRKLTPFKVILICILLAVSYLLLSIGLFYSWNHFIVSTNPELHLSLWQSFAIVLSIKIIIGIIRFIRRKTRRLEATQFYCMSENDRKKLINHLKRDS